MEQLPIEYKKYGYTYKQIIREGNIAIYSQSSEGSNEPFAYIVFIVQKQAASNIYGREYPAKEIVPGHSLWGNYGYTCHTMQRANVRMEEFKTRISNRQVELNPVDITNEDPFGGLNF